MEPVEVLWSGDGQLPSPPGVNRQSDICENITSAHPSDVVGKKDKTWFEKSEITKPAYSVGGEFEYGKRFLQIASYFSCR